MSFFFFLRGKDREREKAKTRLSELSTLSLFLLLFLFLSPPNTDELSYPLHVVLRVEIEAALLKGEMSVADVPKAWDERMRASFGCVPPADDGRVNCLQDM